MNKKQKKKIKNKRQLQGFYRQWQKKKKNVKTNRYKNNVSYLSVHFPIRTA